MDGFPRRTYFANLDGIEKFDPRRRKRKTTAFPERVTKT
jgi:hypothetical protein